MSALRLWSLAFCLATLACDDETRPCSPPPTLYEGTHTIARREAQDPRHWDQCADTGDCLALCLEVGVGEIHECRRVDTASDGARDDVTGDGGADATVTIHIVQRTGACAVD